MPLHRFAIPALVLLAALGRVAPAEADAPPTNAVLADLGLHVIGVGYQRTATKQLVFQIDAESYTPWTQNINLLGLSGNQNKGNTTGVVARGRAFIYPLDTAPAGFWISPFAQAGVGWASVQSVQRYGPLWAVGASAGYSFLIADRVLLALGLGGQYHVAEYPGWNEAPTFHRFYPTIDANLGYAF